jgi:hypothetical protein
MIQQLSDAFLLKITQFSFHETPTYHAVVVGFNLENIIQNAMQR